MMKNLNSKSPSQVNHLVQRMLAVGLALALFFGTGEAQAFEKGQDTGNNFPFKEGTLKQVLDEVEKQSGITFIYLSEEIDPNTSVSIDQSLNTTQEVLEKIFKEKNISYSQKGNQVVLRKNTEMKSERLNIPLTTSTSKSAGLLNLTSKRMIQQDGTVSGKVTSTEDGEALPGVTVLVDGTSNGVVTDIEGNYKIDVTPGQTLVFSFIGFASKSVVVQSQTVINVSLDVDVQQLEEVVVIGYGSVKKRDLTGAVASVKSDDIVRIPTHNAIEAIQGRVAGVDIVRSSGQAGASSSVRIRGNRSLANNDSDRERLNSPLYIIDGFQGGNINDLNPNDIESVEVLKDASSTAIYGYQGANGVIIITTKKGRSGQAKVSYNGYYGVNGLTEFPETRKGADYIAMKRQARLNGISDPQVKVDWRLKDDEDYFTAREWEARPDSAIIDWVDLVMQNGTQQSHTVSASGGSEKTKLFTSIGWFNEESQFRGDVYDRYTIRINVDHEFSNWVKAGVLNQITHSNKDGRRDPLNHAISAKPFGQAFDENGAIIVEPVPGVPTFVSPLADEIPDYATNNTKTNSINLNAYLELSPIKGLSYRMNFGSRFSDRRQGEFYYQDSYSRRTQRTTTTSVSNNHSRYYHWDNILTYSKEIGKHNFGLTGVTNYVTNESESAVASGIGQFLPSQSFHNLVASTTSTAVGSNFVKSNTISYAGRVNYSYAGKYLITASTRYDKASMLSQGHRGAVFPSAAVAWRIVDEPFMSSISLIDELKFRASYGLVGNANISPYDTQSGIIPDPNMSFGEVSAPAYLFTGRIGNKEVGWEKTKSLDLGIDLGLFDSRVMITADAYKSKTSDILLDRGLPWSTGGRSMVVAQNIGATMTRGVEIVLNTVNVDTRDFDWKTTFTFTRAQEKITSLIDDVDLILSPINSVEDSYILGRPTQSYYTFEKLGIWQLGEEEEAALLTWGGSPFEPGDIKLANIDGDSAITASDRKYVGSPIPKYLFGLQNNFNYKGFDLSIYFVGRFGQTILADHLARYDPSGASGSLLLYHYWTEDNPTNDYPKPELTTLFTIAGYQTLPIVNGSYFKLKTVSLGYNLPARWLGPTPVGNLRLYVTGSNLWVKAQHHLLKNYDPENGGDSSYPLNKQIVFGINMDF